MEPKETEGNEDLEEDHTEQVLDERPAMEFRKKEFSMTPSLILDVDKGIDFSAKGMGLKGNRDKPNDA